MELVELRTLGNRARVRGEGEGMHDASTHEVVGDRCDRSLSGGARRGSGGSPSPALWSPGRRGKQTRMGNHKAELRSTADTSLSLSLSLCYWLTSAENGANPRLLAGLRRAPRAWFSRSRIAREVSSSDTLPAFVASRRALEEAPSRALFPRAGAVVTAVPGRRGSHHARPRRSPILFEGSC
jgi:hypothetical protein